MLIASEPMNISVGEALGPPKRGDMILFERFSSRGLAGAYVDMLATDGVIATVAFEPRRHPDPQPFIVKRLQSPPAVS